MIEILLCSLIVSLVTSGFKISTGDGIILNFIKVWLDKIFIKDGETSNVYYPILYCIKCMPSIYGTAICFLFFPVTVHLLYQIPLVVFSSVCINSIFYQWYD